MIYLVTGASRGIGLALTRRLLERGDTVVATARHPEDSDLARLEAPEGRLHRVALDVADGDSVRAAAEETARKVDRIDVLVNNAGIGGGRAPVGAIAPEDVLKVYDVNAVGPLRVVQAFKPLTDRGEGKKLVFVTSKMGSIADNRSGGAYAYRMSKAALNMLAKGLSIDLRPEGYLTLAIHPGWVKTDMGGPNALHGLDESVKGILRLVDGLTAEHSGEHWGAMESRIPW